jgi:RNA polymerase sigma-70 factor (ECF subfamily)
VHGMGPEAFPAVLTAAQAGADWAVACLYRDHNPKLLRYLRAQAGGEAADLAAETWLSAARNLRSFDGDEHAFAGWLFTIARRRLIDHRRAARRRPVHLLASTNDLAGAAPSAEQTALAGVLGDAQARRITALLPADQAEVVLLRLVADLDVDTVARITGRRPGTVRVMQHRALRRLADLLEPPCNAEPDSGDGTPRDAQAPTPPR